ncbi:MAG: UDP-N-acetylglucosamine--N-acetylmuramyl-(pentapeptide) pyrophosphoryl-undecaprenol N-acetylglucosamine transferase, partial [Clostridia bacterium]|nr:UDP-N-acetylglucosamine--N-acetylmuramyl-(pentapeptide) pyrophosphoryl-undecaprenol N-acetylglucosamine transferase [Clostridia bacterium]
MRVLMTGGGTGGHVYPALAIASVIKQNEPDSEIAFVGTPSGMENKLVGNAGYKMYHVNVKGFRRSLSPKNLYAMYLALISPERAKKIIREFKPDIVIGTGGYVSWPILVAAAKLGVPSAVHESNAVPGVTVRRLASYVDRVYINYPESAVLLSHKEKALRVGCPLRMDFEAVDKKTAREKLGIPEDKKVILSFGGSLGAEQVNFAMLDFMEDYVASHPEVVHIHATGSIEWEIATGIYKEKGLDKCNNIRFLEYIHDMPLQMAAADLVICRSGANTVSELALMKKAALFIPSPNVTDNQQFKNANAIAEKGGALLIEE